MNKFKAGVYRKRYGYKDFVPNRIDKPLKLENQEVNFLLAEASRFLGELNAYSTLIPDVDYFIHMHVVKEATKSSKIEGTKTEFDEALMSKNEIAPERRLDWQEVQNYTRAINFSIRQLRNLPISMRLLKQTHKILLSGVRGESKYPGEIRRSQNWIGGSSLQDAFFIPPSHEEIGNLLTDLENFLHNETYKIPPLIKAAIAHYQFETIHPFLDGNGRIGRLLIILYLVDQNILSKPTLYLSDFFEKNKGNYYDSLTVVRHSNDLAQWVKFFLVGVIETAQKSKKTLESIIKLRAFNETKILSLGKRAKNAKQLLDYLYSKPIVDSRSLEKVLNLTHPTVNTLLSDFERLKILRESTGAKRNRLFIFKNYLKIFHD